jgi:predicted MFS family arabinose efflux permease
MEQVPSYTGVMMSLSRAVTQFGSSVGSGVGGMLLLFTGYRFMFTSISILAIASAIAFYLFTIDPLARVIPPTST